MREWKLRDTVIVVFMVLVVGIMLMQMVQNDRLYARINHLIQQLESSGAGGYASLTAGRESTSAGSAVASASTASQPASGGSLVPGAEPGGSIVVHYHAQPATLNPITIKDLYGDIILTKFGYVYEPLLQYNGETLQLEPNMAESYSLSDDKLAVTFKIKPEARWSDGKPVTAQDVVFSFRVMMIPEVDAQRAQSYYVDCDKVTALDDRTVVFHWKKKYFKSVEQSGQVTIVPQHVIDPDNLLDKDPKKLAEKINAWNFELEGKPQVSSGPYLLESWDKVANRVVLRRNKAYWGPKPPLERIIFRFIQNDDASLQALKAGEIDAEWITQEQWQNQTNDKTFLDRFVKRKYLRVDAGFSYIGWNNRRPPFDDPRVRQAMSFCMPGELIKEKVLYNLAELCPGPFNQYGKQASPNVKPWPFDPEKARKLLVEAGFKDSGNGVLERNGKPLTFSLLVPTGSPTYDQICALFQDQLSKIGVKMNIDPYEWSVFMQRLDERNFDACMLGWGGVPEEDPYQIWHSSSLANKGSNHIGYNNPEVDRLIVEARQEFDEDKRNAIYHRVDELIVADQPYTFLFTMPSLLAHSKRLENVTTDKLGVDFEKWWVPRALRKPGE